MKKQANSEQLFISCGTQKSAKIPQPGAKMIWSFVLAIFSKCKRVIIDCQLNSLLKNCLKTVIVGLDKQMY